MTQTHRQDHPVLKVGGVLVALFAEVFSAGTSLSDLLVAVLTRACLVEAIFLLGEGHGGLDVEVVRFVTMAKVKLLHLCKGKEGSFYG